MKSCDENLRNSISQRNFLKSIQETKDLTAQYIESIEEII